MTAGDRGHDHAGDALSGLLDGELGPAEAARVDAHLAACARCSHELAVVTWVREVVGRLPAVEPPPGFLEAPGFLQTLPGAGPSTSPPRLRPAWRWGIGAAAAAALVAAGMAGGGSPPGPSGRPGPPSVAQLVDAQVTGAPLDGDPLRQLTPGGVLVRFGG